MKKLISKSLFTLGVLATYLSASPLKADDTTHVIIDAEKTAEVVADYCENTVDNPNPSPACLDAIEECQVKAGVAFAGQILLKVSNKAGCIQLEKDGVKFYSCNNVAFADLLEDLNAIDAQEHFGEKLGEVCKTETAVNNPPSDSGENNSNDDSAPSNANDTSAAGGCSLQGQGISLSSIPWFAGSITLLFFGLTRRHFKKNK